MVISFAYISNQHLRDQITTVSQFLCTNGQQVQFNLNLVQTVPNSNALPIINIFNKVHTSPLFPIRSCWFIFRIWLCTVSSFDKGWGGGG